MPNSINRITHLLEDRQYYTAASKLHGNIYAKMTEDSLFKDRFERKLRIIVINRDEDNDGMRNICRKMKS